MKRVALVQVPYHLGREGVGLAKGVPVLAEALAREDTALMAVERGAEFRNEIAASMDVVRAIADRVRAAVADGHFPVVVAGNCNSALGTVAALGTPRDLAVIWFDAHADFNTPETSESGFFDGMGLAMLTGSGWAALRAAHGVQAIPEENVLLVGVRDAEEREQARLDASRVTVVGRGSLSRALDRLRERCASAYVHVDLDVLDPAEGRANWWAVEGGLSLGELEEAIEEIARRFPLRAAALTAYQPDADAECRVPGAARAVFERIVAAAASQRVTA